MAFALALWTARPGFINAPSNYLSSYPPHLDVSAPSEERSGLPFDRGP